MKKLIILFVLLGTGFSVMANDGVFYAQGSTLIPLRETVIRMQKEILSLDRKGEWMQVDIYFEFFNPGALRELTVGFVTPPAFGDVEGGEEEGGAHPQIRDFMVMAGNEILPYKKTRMKDSGFRISDSLSGGYDFVYYFQVNFPKGLSVIRHSYMYRGGMSVEEKQAFFYRLSTGSSWAGGRIGDFELNINMGDDSYFAVPASFGAGTADWTLVGVGRISPVLRYAMFGMEDEARQLRMVYLRKGKLQLRKKDFSPRTDLSLVVFQLHNEIRLWGNSEKHTLSRLTELWWMESDSVAAFLPRLSDAELRAFRNLNYARRGMLFKDEGLRKLFSSFFWYLPDPLVSTEGTPDYYLTKEQLQLIREEENRRKNKPAG